MIVGLGTLVSRARELFESDADGEVVAVDPDTCDYFGFNGTASALWRLLREPRTVDDLVETLTQQFAVDRATCERDVVDAIEWLEQAKLVRLERGSAP